MKRGLMIGLIILLVLGASLTYFLIEKEKLSVSDNIMLHTECKLDYSCENPESLSELNKAKCEIKNSNSSTASSIRIQSKIKDAWEQNPPSAKEISAEITCNKNSDNMRGYFAGMLRLYVSRKSESITKQDLLAEERDILSIVEGSFESAELRGKIFNELTRTYYYLGIKGAESDNIYATAAAILEEEDSIASLGVGALVGPLADIDLIKSKKIIKEFIKSTSPDEKPIAFSSAIIPFIVYDEDENHQDAEIVALSVKYCEEDPNYSFCRYVNMKTP